MNAKATIKNIRIISAMTISEGAGVTVKRTIGIPTLRNYDPFLMLDQISSDDPDDYIAGFPSHPHRGFITFTYMIDGDMEHKDSMGNSGNLGSGGAQWMKAGSGVIHSEMPKQKEGLLRGFQLWINLPTSNKLDEPAYQEYKSESFPVVEDDNFTVKVLIGEFNGMSSPIVDEITDVSYFDVQLKPHQQFHYDLPKTQNTFLYVFEGNGKVGEQALSSHELAVLDVGSALSSLIAGDNGIRFLLVSGKPTNEPIVQYGPFVMNTREEIDEAMRDYQFNNFVRSRAWINRKNNKGS